MKPLTPKTRKKQPPTIPLSSVYKVGKAKLPIETRFRPGHSGNPKGRPKGAKNKSKPVKLLIGMGSRRRSASQAIDLPSDGGVSFERLFTAWTAIEP
jgi:hypothetical protein